MKICIPITSRAAWGRLKPVLVHLSAETRPRIILAGSTTLERYGNVAAEIRKEWNVVFTCQSAAAGDSPGTMAIETGLLTTELVSAFEQLKPDFVLAHADRYETLAVATAAAYMNIPLGHTQGGEKTGSIDDKVRDAVSMLADYHYPCTQLAAERLLEMGCENVTVTGCPSLNNLTGSLPLLYDIPVNQLGHGATIDFDEPYMLACMHPDTTNHDESLRTLRATLDAIAGYQTIWLTPNIDAYGQEMAKTLNQHAGPRTRIIKHLPQQQFYALMAHCTCMVGNSSASIREGSFMGVPAVVVGMRQDKREVCGNVELIQETPGLAAAIQGAVERQIAHGAYPRDITYGDGYAAQAIADAMLNTVSTL